MDSLFAIGVGLVLRILMDAVTDNDDRVSGVLVGLWEGVVLSHFVRRMPRSFDPYLGFGFRIFVDFLFTKSLSRLSLVALWALVGMLLADLAPSVWRDSGLRHLYRQVQKDVRHVQRAMPRFRIKNDLPSVRLFKRSRPSSSSMSSSVRSDRATHSRSPAPSPVPTPSPVRRPGRSPPGTFPNVSGWSETGTDVSNVREDIVTNPGPSPSIIPSRELEAHGRVDTTHVATSRKLTTIRRDTPVAITHAQKKSASVSVAAIVEATTLGVAITSTSLEPIEDESRHNPPTIPDDWVDVDRPAPARVNEPVAAFKPDPDPTPEPQPGPSSPTPSQLTSIIPPSEIDVLLDIPDADHGNKGSGPDQIPLPASRAASVIGGMYDQPQPRSALRDSLQSRVDKATSEIGVDHAKSFAPMVATQSTKSQTTTTSRSWFTSRTGSKLKHSVDTDAPQVPPKEPRGEPVGQNSELPMTNTPAQVDPPSNILTQSGDTSPLLFSTADTKPGQKQGPSTSKPDQTLADDAGVDGSAVPPQGGAGKENDVGPSETLLDLLSPPSTPPPPFTEFEGVPLSPAAGQAPAEPDPAMQDELQTALTEEQKAAEERRQAFLSAQVQELETSRAGLQKQLDKEDDPVSSPAKAIESDLEDSEKMLTAVKTRLTSKVFPDPSSGPSIREISLVNKSVSEVQTALASAVLETLLARSDAGPMTIQATINKQRTLKGKGKDAKDAVMAFAKRHKFVAQFEPATPGVINITF